MQASGLLITISGMILEIIAAFILAADAIGLERINAWALQIRGARDDMVDADSPDKTPKHQRRGRLLHFLVTLTCTMAGTYAVTGYFQSKELPTLTVIGLALATGLFCAVLTHFGVILFKYLLAALASFLLYVEHQTSTRMAGIIGFGLLLVGFVLQLAGTLIQYCGANTA